MKLYTKLTIPKNFRKQVPVEVEYICEFCGHIMNGIYYNDKFYIANIIQKIVCEKCRCRYIDKEKIRAARKLQLAKEKQQKVAMKLLNTLETE